MVEVHLVGLETAAAISARNLTPLAQHLPGSVLADAHSEDFLVAIATVPIGVRRPLVALLRHG